MRTIIAGSRSIGDPATVDAAMQACGWTPTAVLSGAAPGVDTLGERWAQAHGIWVEPFPAEWRANGVFDRGAGHKRNELMAQHCDALVAVWDGSSPGTRDMIERATRYGRRVYVHTVKPVLAIPAPLPLESMRYGHVLRAGLGWSTVLADMDYETYSEAGFYWDNDAGKWLGPPGAPGSKRDDKGLPAVGAANYTAHPTCEVLSLYYDLKDGKGPRWWRPGMPLPQDLFDHAAAGKLIEAHNNGFERWVWENVCTPRYGWPPCPQIEQWRCSMAKCRAHALPGGLAEVGKVLAVEVGKDAEGDRLIKKFTMPQKPSRLDPRTRHEMLLTNEDPSETLALLLDRDDLKPAEIRKLRSAVADDVLDSERFISYNRTDIIAESHVSSRVPDLSEDELRFWIDDQRINRRGVQIDVEGMHNCCAILDQALARYGEEMRQLTGCEPTEVKKLIGWMHAFGVHVDDSLDEDVVADLLKRRAQLPPNVVRALEIRAAVGSASVKKVYAMRARVTAQGRLHDMYVFHGAHTGRPTGEGVQSTNLPKAGPNVYRCGYDSKGRLLPAGGCGRWHGSHTLRCPWCQHTTLRGPKDAEEWNPAAVKDALIVIATRSLPTLEHYFGHALLTIAGCLRGLFIAKPGHVLISSDFTAIEGVVIACLAGEQWRIDAYARGEPMYLLSAERMFGVSVAEMEAYAGEHGKHHPLRQKGKGGELGLGFGGWINALRQFDVDGTDEELKDLVLRWRKASPNLEWFWGGQTKGTADTIRQNAGLVRYADRYDRTPYFFGLEGMMVEAIKHPGIEYPVLRMDGTPTGISYLMQGDVLYCRVPSGGLLTYHRPRLSPAAQEWRGMSIRYEGWNSNPKNGPKGWISKSIYGGRAAENVTQKVARDIQMNAINRLERAGYPIVMHTYDEDVAEVPETFGSVEELESTMVQPLPWTIGWPIKAANGWRDTRYCKA